MKIYLIRHGQTTGDVEDRYGGAYDDELSNEGIIQTHDLADKLGDYGIQILFCSPLIRAQQTAKILKSKLNCEIKIIKDLRERNKNGILTGMTRQEAKIKYPKLVEELKDYRSQIQEAEPQGDFAKRIKKVFTEIVNYGDYSTIGIVTHGMPFWVVFTEILNDNGIISVGNCAYVVLEKNGPKFTIEKLDGVEYKKN